MYEDMNKTEIAEEIERLTGAKQSTRPSRDELLEKLIETKNLLEPVIDEPVIDEPVIDEPVIDEPVTFTVAKGACILASNGKHYKEGSVIAANLIADPETFVKMGLLDK